MPDRQYWNERYFAKQTGWDIGHVSTPIKEYFDKVTDKSIKILIPGSGKGWEAEYLYNSGFRNVYILDYSENAIKEFKVRCPWFPTEQIIIEDFFDHFNKYDLIVEQTFFSSLLRPLRIQYAKQICNLLIDSGKLVGLLFNHEFEFTGPPFGGTSEEYMELFKPYFDFLVFETARNSIVPRMGRELFIVFQRNGS